MVIRSFESCLMTGEFYIFPSGAIFREKAEIYLWAPRADPVTSQLKMKQGHPKLVSRMVRANRLVCLLITFFFQEYHG